MQRFSSRFFRACVVTAGLTAGLSSAGGWAQGAASPQKASPAKPGVADPAPVAPAQGQQSDTPPVLESGRRKITIEKRLTKAQEDKLLADSEEIFRFASKDTGLPIKAQVKKHFVSRDEVNKDLRKRFDEDKGNKKMEQSELVLKKFGLLDRDFQLRPFLLSLLTEQIAGYYDNKEKTMNLLDWVPEDEQKSVMAHELTHALQDQKVNLKDWQDLEPEGTAKTFAEDNKHIATDESGTAREAVLEGQAMVSFIDWMMKPAGRTLKDAPQIAGMMAQQSSDTSESPILAKAPLVLQDSLLFPYTAGLNFEAEMLAAGGTEKAFAQTLTAPPNSTFEILHPKAFVAHAAVPVMSLPDIHPTLEAAGYGPYDVGVMGELDVKMTAELFGGRPMAEALAPQWNGGTYYAAQRKSATAEQKLTTASLALFYVSDWKSPGAARDFLKIFDQQMPRQYDRLTRRDKDETDADERVYTTAEGDVLLRREGTRVWVSEGFDLPLARKLREMVEGAQGSGPIRQAEIVPRKELLGGLTAWIGSFGMMKAALKF